MPFLSFFNTSMCVCTVNLFLRCSSSNVGSFVRWVISNMLWLRLWADGENVYRTKAKAAAELSKVKEKKRKRRTRISIRQERCSSQLLLEAILERFERAIEFNDSLSPVCLEHAEKKNYELALLFLLLLLSIASSECYVVAVVYL